MDDATVQRKRIPKLDEMAGRLPSMHDASEPNTPQNNKVLDALYVAYADGLEAAAKVAKSMEPKGPPRLMDEKTWIIWEVCQRMSYKIRQHAKEMGHE